MSYAFPLTIQLVLPEGYRADSDFCRVLDTLRQYGFSGVELNSVHPDRIDPSDLKGFLAQFELKMTMFATGLTAKSWGLSLSTPDEEARERSAKRALDFIDFAHSLETGMIVGFFKGGPEPDRISACRNFSDSLARIVPAAQEKRVAVLVEATNRYESAVANSLDDTHEIIAPFADNPYVKILPDTFHMNIEERDQFEALRKHFSLFDWIHISDNNRYFPGLGAIRFHELFAFLEKIGYRGGLAIEGKIEKDLVRDIQATMRYLKPLLEA